MLINRTRQANMVLPGQSLLLMQVAPALYGAYIGNKAEKAAPDLTLMECSMIGASSRLYLAGPTASLRKAQARAERLLAEVEGR